MELVDGITLLDFVNSVQSSPLLRKRRSRNKLSGNTGTSYYEHRSDSDNGEATSDSLKSDAVWSIFVQLVAALRFLHVEMNIVHRDITPSNIMIMNGVNNTNSIVAKRIKLTDFGLSTSSLHAGSSSSKTFLRSVVGTIEYSCPEMITSNCYDSKADVWSAGCVLYHMLAKKPPFKGSNPFSTAALIVDGDFSPFPEHVRKQHDTTLITLISRLLQKDPKQRPYISEVGALISEQVMSEMDRMQQEEDRLYEQLLIERDRRLRENSIANKQQEAYRRLLVTRESDSNNGSRAVTASDFPSDVNIDTDSSNGKRNSDSQFETPSSSFSISISQNKVRQIADPTTQILGLMHKLMYVSTLPMHSPSPVGTVSDFISDGRATNSNSLSANMKRKAVDRYVSRYLFGASFRGGSSIKHEVVKLLEGSQEVIPIEFSLKIFNDNNNNRRQLVPNRITYESMKAMIEEIISDHGYYNIR